MASFGTRVGAKSSVDPTRAGYARDIQLQMKGIEKNLTAYINEIKGVTQGVLREALTPTFEKSRKYCPKDTGELVQSGYLEIRGRGQKIQAEIGYGKGGRPFYTVFVHEMTNYFHKAPTRAKWLQIALQEDMDKLHGRIVRAYRAKMRKK